MHPCIITASSSSLVVRERGFLSYPWMQLIRILWKMLSNTKNENKCIFSVHAVLVSKIFCLPFIFCCRTDWFIHSFKGRRGARKREASFMKIWKLMYFYLKLGSGISTEISSFSSLLWFTLFLHTLFCSVYLSAWFSFVRDIFSSGSVRQAVLILLKNLESRPWSVCESVST